MKPLRPFPLPLKIGTDICQISRIYAIISGSGGGSCGSSTGRGRAQRFIDRVLSPEEQAADRARLRLGSGGGDAVREEAEGWGRGRFSRIEGEGGSMSWREMKRRDPELWNTATFMAGR
jgi:holo-[acyl-carrier protein] synthase